MQEHVHCTHSALSRSSGSIIKSLVGLVEYIVENGSADKK